MGKRFWVAVAAGGLLGGSAVAGFGPLVESRVAARAESYGAEIDVDSVRPGLEGVSLRGVSVIIPSIPGMRISADDVLVSWSEQRILDIKGARITAVGSVAELTARIDAWRGNYFRGSGAGQGAAKKYSGFDLSWSNRREEPSRWLQATDVQVTRAAGEITVAAAGVLGKLEGTTFQAGRGRLRVGRSDADGFVLKELVGDLLRIKTSTSEISASAEVAADLAPETERALAQRSDPRGSADSKTREENTDTAPRVLEAIALHRKLMEGAGRLGKYVASDAVVEVKQMSATVERGGHHVTLGPGTFRLGWDDGMLSVELAPQNDVTKGEPAALTFALKVPAAGTSAERSVTMALQGGPLPLALFGLKDGDFSLKDLGRSSLVGDLRLILPADGRTVALDGYGKVEELTIDSRKVAAEAISGVGFAWRGRIELGLDGASVNLQRFEVDVGEMRLLLDGDLLRLPGEQYQVSLDYEMPLVTCQKIIDGVPKGMIPNLAGIRLVGSIGLKGHARFNTANLTKSFDLDWDGSNSCRVDEVPAEIDVNRFRKKFRKMVYTPKGEMVEMEFGKGTTSWVPYSATSKYMDSAALICEDGRFYRHNGFDKEAIINSIRENIRERRFIRGASTISMQLAKNLYLTREKNLSRKLQEAVLTTYLEQQLTKQEMMELYLNVIEFGPMIYGIGNASRHYFHSHPARLSLGQALYLGSILRAPQKHFFGAGGAVIPSRMSYLKRLMKIANKIHRISDEELEEGLRETVVFGSPAPYRAEESDIYETAPDGDSPDPVNPG